MSKYFKTDKQFNLSEMTWIHVYRAVIHWIEIKYTYCKAKTFCNSFQLAVLCIILYI